jgi:choline dehydrogenase-like flavoprotein
MAEKTYDFCIVGVGACGGLLAKELSERGYSVVGLDAGPRYSLKTDIVNDEAEMLKLFWNEPRTFAGKDPVHVMSGFGVGGGTLVWCGVTPRFHEADFRTRTLEGVGEDWPITYKDLAPYYDRVERDFGVSGNHRENPWDVPRGPYPMPAIEWSWACQVMARGVEKVGARPLHGPLAITSEPYRGREACVKCGFCISGCPSTAKGCTLTDFVPRAEKNGAEIRVESFVYNVTYDARKNRVTGVEYYDVNNKSHRVQAKTVIVTAHPMETSRLLLLSRNNTFPEGLANSSGLVGKNFMVHWDISVYGQFEQKMNAFKGPIMGNLLVQDWYDTDPKRDFARGYVLESFLPHPFYFGVAGPAFWGKELKDVIKAYDHTAGWWVCGESLPNDNNTVTLDPEVKDHRGLPVVRSTHEWADNDKKMMRHATQNAIATLEAAGARKAYVGITMSAHPMGTARMGTNPEKSAVNPYCQAHDIPNLFVCDPSVFVTGSGLNHTLTAMAIASRAGEYMVEAIKRGDL